MSGVLGGIASHTLHVCLLVSFSLAVKYQYQCTCPCIPEEQCQLPDTVVEYIRKSCREYIDHCSRSGSGDCQCCWLCTERISSSNCTCKYDMDDSSDSSEDEEDGNIVGIGIGIGVGVGLSVLIAAVLALFVYCRIQGRREGRRESQQNKISSRKSKGESEIYSEIDENVIQAGGRSTHVNPGYNTTEEVIGPTKNNVYLGLNKADATTINHQYKSLKKPNQDLGSGDYADPEKYTEPPVLPQRNSNVIDNDEEDYVSQGTPEPARNNEGDDEKEDIDDYVDHGTSSSTRVKMETHSPSEELTSASEPFSQETGAIMAKASGQEHNNSDYITGVDTIADPNVDSEEVIEHVESDYIDM